MVQSPSGSNTILYTYNPQNILGCRLFLFQYFKYIMPLPSGLKISTEKSTYGDPLVYDSLFFFCHLQNSLFIFSFYHFSYGISWRGCVSVHVVWEPLLFLYLDICFLTQVHKVSSHHFIKYIFSKFWSSSGNLIMQMLIQLMLFQRSLKLLSFLKVVFLSAVLFQ